MKLRHWIWVLALLGALTARAEEEVPDLNETQTPPAPVSLIPGEGEGETSSSSDLFGSFNDKNLLMLGLRIDAAYAGGGSASQGFSLPGARLTAWGSAGDWIQYRFSLGQTREFSSVLLPQLLPVEGYIELNSSAAVDWDPQSRLSLRMGMFTPHFNPWWTPDLADLPLPDYNETHRSLFLSRDIGAEAIFEPFSPHLAFFVGLFNGTGIFALNTNNAKAITAGVRGKFSLGSAQFQVGLSTLSRQQADPASVNFRSDFLGNLYASVEWPESGVRVCAETMGGELNDSVRTAFPFGGAGILQFPLYQGISWFTRAEVLRNSGSGNGLIQSAQIGPLLELHKTTHAYLFYQYLDSGGSVENAGWLRLRLVL